MRARKHQFSLSSVAGMSEGVGPSAALNELRRHVLSLRSAGSLPATVAASLLATIDASVAFSLDEDAESDSSMEESTSDRVSCGAVFRGSAAPSRRRAIVEAVVKPESDGEDEGFDHISQAGIERSRSSRPSSAGSRTISDGAPARVRIDGSDPPVDSSSSSLLAKNDMGAHHSPLHNEDFDQLSLRSGDRAASFSSLPSGGGVAYSAGARARRDLRGHPHADILSNASVSPSARAWTGDAASSTVNSVAVAGGGAFGAAEDDDDDDGRSERSAESRRARRAGRLGVGGGGASAGGHDDDGGSAGDRGSSRSGSDEHARESGTIVEQHLLVGSMDADLGVADLVPRYLSLRREGRARLFRQHSGAGVATAGRGVLARALHRAVTVANIWGETEESGVRLPETTTGSRRALAAPALRPGSAAPRRRGLDAPIVPPHADAAPTRPTRSAGDRPGIDDVGNVARVRTQSAASRRRA